MPHCRSARYGPQRFQFFVRDGREYHFNVVRRADFTSLPGHTAPVFADKDGMTVASWSDATRHYVVASDGGRAALQGLL